MFRQKLRKVMLSLCRVSAETQLNGRCDCLRRNATNVDVHREAMYTQRVHRVSVYMASIMRCLQLGDKRPRAWSNRGPSVVACHTR